MAQIREVRLVDDTDGSEAVEQLEFSLDGKSYEIDLSAENATHLREALAPYIAAGRRSGRVPARSARPALPVTRSAAVQNRRENEAIREWARARGHEVSDRGRIATKIVEAYRAENGNTGGNIVPEFAAAS